MTRVLIVGAGIAGLSAAVAAVDESVDANPATHTVTVWESDDQVGGKLRTSPFAGVVDVDEGADAYLTRVPYAVDLAATVGLDSFAHPATSKAAVWHDGLHMLPAGLVLGVPANPAAMVGTSLLSWRGKLRAGLDLVMPRTSTDDDSLGALARRRLGGEVHDRLIDTLIGSIYATDTMRTSLSSVPQVAGLATSRSLIAAAYRSRRQQPVDPQRPIFAAPTAGMQRLAEAAARYATAKGATISTGRTLASLERDGSGWRADDEYFDRVVLAIPAPRAAALVRSCAPDLAAVLQLADSADVMMVRVELAGTDWPNRLTEMSGYLVPKPDQRFVTAVSFGSQKWSRWQPANGNQILRVSLGRDGMPIAHLSDDDLLAATVSEVGTHLGFEIAPLSNSITRWTGGFPQYRPHHDRWLGRLRELAPPGLFLAGASYHGIGVPACIASGRRAVRADRSVNFRSTD